MTEQAVKLQRIVPGKADTATGEQAVALVSFVDAAGNPVDVGGGGEATPEARLVPAGGVVGQVLTRGAGEVAVWAADQNTSYPVLTAAQATAGTATTPSTISAKVLADEIDRRVAAAIAAIPPAGG